MMTRLLLAFCLAAAPLSSLCAQPEQTGCCCPDQTRACCVDQAPADAPAKAVVAPQPALAPVFAVPAPLEEAVPVPGKGSVSASPGAPPRPTGLSPPRA